MATTTNRLSVEVRTRTGKGASRRARRDGKVPAVLYGHGSEPQHLTLNAHDFGPHVGKHHRRERPGANPCDLKNADAAERTSHADYFLCVNEEMVSTMCGHNGCGTS